MTPLDQTVHQTVTFSHTGALVKFARICSWPQSKVLRIKRAMQMKICLIALGRSGFLVNIQWNWRQNCKRTSLSPKECTVCNLYGRRYRSLCGNSHALLSHMLTLARTDGQIASDCGWYLHLAMLSSVGYEDGRPGGSVHMTEPSCRFNSRRNSHWFSGSCLNTQFHSIHTFRNSAALHVN